MQTSLMVGCGAGFSGDRLDAALPVVRTLIARGKPAVLIFENLAERTLAFAQMIRSQHPEQGYEPLLARELEPVLAACLEHGIVIVGNFGAANPAGAAACIRDLAQRLGLQPPRIAIVIGDDVRPGAGVPVLDQACAGDEDRRRFVSANAYQGAFRGSFDSSALYDGSHV